MAESQRPQLFVALVHFPVVNKRGEIVTSSVTTLDVHDLARICRTYAVEGLYVVTPLPAQQTLVHRIIEHWMTGYGAQYNPTRKEALTTARVVSTLEEAVADVTQRTGGPPATLVPDARRFPQSISYPRARQVLAQPGPFLLLLGTAWGLEKGLVERADWVLEPIEGLNQYNHLPVRAAAAVILDRLLGGGPTG